jgi:hypothetical protein
MDRRRPGRRIAAFSRARPVKTFRRGLFKGPAVTSARSGQGLQDRPDADDGHHRVLPQGAHAGPQKLLLHQYGRQLQRRGPRRRPPSRPRTSLIIGVGADPRDGERDPTLSVAEAQRFHTSPQECAARARSGSTPTSASPSPRGGRPGRASASNLPYTRRRSTSRWACLNGAAGVLGIRPSRPRGIPPSGRPEVPSWTGSSASARS